MTGAVELREVHGPVAFGRDWRRFCTLVWLLARTEFKLRYAGSLLGPLWGLLRPMAIFGVLYVVFTEVIRFGEQTEHYAPLLLFNIMLFFFFSDATTTALRSLVRNERMVRKTQFPRAAIPIASVLTHCFNLGFNLAVVMAFLGILGVPARSTWLLIPVAIALLVLLTVCVAALLSSLYARYRDVEQIWSGVATRVLFYGSPVLFPIEFVPEGFRHFVLFNPLAPLLVEGRRWVFDPDAPGLGDVASGAEVIIPIAVFALTCFAGIAVFVRRAPRVAEGL